MYEISIIIPTYKPQDYLFECLASIQKQFFSKDMFEVILVLNGEKKPYYDTIKNYIKCELAGYHVELLYADIAGVSNARNIGIEKSSGKYITFIDDDDVISENYLQGMYAIARDDIMPLSYIKSFKDGTTDKFNEYITDLYEKNQNKYIYILNTRSFFSVLYCKLIKKEIISNRELDPRFKNGEDALFMFSISDKIKRIQFTDKTSVYYHRVRENSLTTRQMRWNYKLLNCVKLIYAYTAAYLRNPLRYNFLFYMTRIIATIKNFNITTVLK